MVAEPWIHKMRQKKKPPPPAPVAPAAPPPPPSPPSLPPSTIGILSFEVAAAMSRAVQLHRSLSDGDISRHLSQTLSSHSLRTLISPHDSHLLSLALAEKLDDLNRIASATSRLGRRCSHPALLGFDHVYSDLLSLRIPDLSSLGFLSKDMDASVRRMDRFVSSTAALYSELQSLAQLEHSVLKFTPSDDTRRSFHHKIHSRRRDLKLLRDASLWNQSYDKVVLLLARATCTIHSRIRHVFGDAALVSLNGLASSPPLRRHIPLNSGPIYAVDGTSGPIPSEGRSVPIRLANSDSTAMQNFRKEGLRLHCGATPGRLFMDCLSLRSSADGDGDDRTENESCLSRSITSALVPFSGKLGTFRFGPKSRLLELAPPSTVGGSALALHYANVIIIIEKFLRYPHLVGEEARDDLYQMLPLSLRSALRRSLRSYVKNLAIYDAPLAHDWKEAMDKILSWLAPMAHNMIQWQTERNFEQQQIVQRAKVLLLETLYFADREKTEAAICELLVGLNYICRYEQQQNALLDCTSSVDFDDCMDWQLQS